MYKKVYEKAQVCCKNFETGRIITNSSLLAKKMIEKEAEYQKAVESVQREAMGKSLYRDVNLYSGYPLPDKRKEDAHGK